MMDLGMYYSSVIGRTSNKEYKSIEDGPTYYNKLAHLIEVRYYDGSRYVLFKCDWANIK